MLEALLERGELEGSSAAKQLSAELSRGEGAGISLEGWTTEDLIELHQKRLDSGAEERECRAILRLLQHRLDSPTKVLAQFDKHAELHAPTDGVTLKVQALLRLRRWDEAIDCAFWLAERQPDWPRKRWASVVKNGLREIPEHRDEFDRACARRGLARAFWSGGEDSTTDPAQINKMIKGLLEKNDLRLAVDTLERAQRQHLASPRMYLQTIRALSRRGESALVDEAIAIAQLDSIIANDSEGPDHLGALEFSRATAYMLDGRIPEAAAVFQANSHRSAFLPAEARAAAVRVMLESGNPGAAAELLDTWRTAAAGGSVVAPEPKLLNRTLWELVRIDIPAAVSYVERWPLERLEAKAAEYIVRGLFDRDPNSAIKWLVEHRDLVPNERALTGMIGDLCAAEEDDASLGEWLRSAAHNTDEDRVRGLVAARIARGDAEQFLAAVLAASRPKYGVAQVFLAEATAAASGQSLLTGSRAAGAPHSNTVDAGVFAKQIIAADESWGRLLSDVRLADHVVELATALRRQRHSQAALELLRSQFQLDDPVSVRKAPPAALYEWMRALAIVDRPEHSRAFRAVLDILAPRQRRRTPQTSQRGRAGAVPQSSGPQRAERVRQLVEGWASYPRTGRYGEIQRVLKRIGDADIAPTPATVAAMIVNLPRESRREKRAEATELLQGQPFTASVWAAFTAGDLIIGRFPTGSNPPPEEVRRNVLDSLRAGEETLLEGLAAMRDPRLEESERRFSNMEFGWIADAYPSNRYRDYASLSNDFRLRGMVVDDPDRRLEILLLCISEAHARYGNPDGVDRMRRAWHIGVRGDWAMPHRFDIAFAQALINSGADADAIERTLRVSHAESWSIEDLGQVLRAVCGASGLSRAEAGALVSIALDSTDLDGAELAQAVETAIGRLLRAQGRDMAQLLLEVAAGTSLRIRDDLRLSVEQNESAPVGVDVADRFGPDSLTAAQFSAFQGLVAHDLGLPGINMGLAQAYVDALQKMTTDEGPAEILVELRDCITGAQRRVKRMSRLLQLGADGEPGSASVDAVVADVLEVLGPDLERAGITVEVQSGPGLRIETNRSILAFVLENLVDNSIKELVNNHRLEPRIEVSAAYQSPSADDEEARFGSVLVSVRDNGRGFPEALRKDLRDQNYETKPGHGLGIGLGRSSDAARLFGGSLESRDTAEGAFMVVTLPVANSKTGKGN